MKTTIKIISLFFVPALVGVWLSSCENFNVVAGIGEVIPVTVTVNANVIHDPDEPLPPILTVKFFNVKENWTKVVEMDASLSINIEGIVPGNYVVTVTGEYNDGAQRWMYSGGLSNQYLFGGVPKRFDIDIKIGRTGPFVLKELYWGCCRTPTNGTYAEDQFYEIYNNSESIAYCDSLCFTRIYPNVATGVAGWAPWVGDDVEDFVFSPDCWQIPGDGTTYPLAPGESAILCERAENHTLSLYNPNSVNQISCEFEFWVRSTTFPTDQPAINMNLVFGSASGRWLTTVNGPAYVLFRQKGPIDRNFTTTTTDATTRYLKIRRKDVIDAVECVNNWSYVTSKRIPLELDAGATTVEATYTGKSVARKIQSLRPDGTIIYQDTNNSTEDFEIMDKAQIRRYGPKIPSWNTWHSLDPNFP